MMQGSDVRNMCWVFLSKKNPISLKQKYPGHVPNITDLHNAQFGEYGSACTMVIIGGAESALHGGKEDILKAVGIRVNFFFLFFIFDHGKVVKVNKEPGSKKSCSESEMI